MHADGFFAPFNPAQVASKPAEIILKSVIEDLADEGQEVVFDEPEEKDAAFIHIEQTDGGGAGGRKALAQKATLTVNMYFAGDVEEGMYKVNKIVDHVFLSCFNGATVEFGRGDKALMRGAEVLGGPQRFKNPDRPTMHRWRVTFVLDIDIRK